MTFALFNYSLQKSGALAHREEIKKDTNLMGVYQAL